MPGHGHPHRGGVLDCRRPLARRDARRRVDLHRTAGAAAELSEHPEHHLGRIHHGVRGDPPRLRAPSENSTFAEVCRACGITFIGPSPEAIRLMGDKAQARGMANAAGAPVVPGSQAPLDGVDEAQALADEIGYPVMVKAASGGGGRGMRIVRERESLARAYATCQSEAHASFGSPDLYLEKFVEEAAPRRGPGAGRPERVPRPHGRARLLDPAPPPEAARGVARHVHLPGHARGTVQVRARRRQCRQLRLRGHRGVPRRPRRQLLLHRDEHADPGGASGHRAGHRIRPRPRADPHRRGRVPRLQAGRHPVQWARHRVRINAEDPEHFTPSPGRVTAWVPPGGPGSAWTAT